MNRVIKLFSTFVLFFISTRVIMAQSGYVGETIYLSAPSVFGIIDAAAWYSVNHDDNLSVSGNANGGQVKINSYFSGTATINCQYAYHYYVGSKKEYGNGTVQYNISCKPSQASLNKQKVSLQLGDEIELTYVNSSGFNLPFAIWRTSDKNVAAFTESISCEWTSGKTVTISALKVGKCIITLNANSGGENPTCLITVTADPPQSISITPKALSLKEGQSGNFTYSLIPSNTYATVAWSSSNEKVAQVSSDGTITAISAGKATITAKTNNGLSASGIVEVMPLPQSISLPNNIDIYLGYSKTLKPTLYPANATTSYTWTSTDSKIATVNSNGKVYGRTTGTTTINITTDNKKSSSCRITVKEPPTGMDFRNTEIRIKTLKNIIKTSLQKLK